MLETQNGSISLEELEKLLEQSLSHDNVTVVPRRISCLLRDGNLMILLHYQQPAMPYPRKLFNFINDLLDKLLICSQYQILMYLVVQGEYRNNLKNALVNIDATLTPILPQTTVIEPITKPSSKTFKLPRYTLPIIGILSLISLGYLAQRHCLLGNNCYLIPQANNLAKQAELIINYTPKDLDTAVAHLNKATNILQSIPSISPHHREAEYLINNYKNQSQRIENLLQAQLLQDQALSLTKLPISIEESQKIVEIWDKAIALLETIPDDNPLYPLTQPKLEKIKLEKQAIISLKTAQEAAELGKVRESVARSLENWQLVVATWRTALERIQSIPPDSQIASSNEIRQLNIIYESRLAQSNQKLAEETVVAKIYHQAQQQAQLAHNQSQEKQWQTAVNHWRQAIEMIKQIPETSSFFPEAQTIANNYQNYLKQAQSQQTIALNLEQICTADVKICNYSLESGVIKIELTSSYQEQLQQVALATDGANNAPAQMELRQHLSGLETMFQSISNNTGIPIEIYNAQQELIATYSPS